jgi:hypothetical protein
MNGASVASSGGVAVPTTWSIVGQRDFNGDHDADLLWRDTSGNTAIWFMSGTQVASSTSIGNIPNTWSVAATADFNGDGKGDILWRDSSGKPNACLCSGTREPQTGGDCHQLPGSHDGGATADKNHFNHIRWGWGPSCKRNRTKRCAP